MNDSQLPKSDNIQKQNPVRVKPIHALADLAIFLSVMFLVRTFEIELLGFWGNAIFKTTATVGVATLLLYYRKQSWKDIGLTKPDSYLRMIAFVAVILIGTVVSIMIFELFVRDLFAADETSNSVSSRYKWSLMKDNIPYFVSILLLVWVESFLEELQDRGFSLNRFQELFAKIPLSAMLAVLCQAAIFGFRHSYDLSPRSITTGLIGFVFGTVYILSGRNLWPLIIAHIILNTMSMIE